MDAWMQIPEREAAAATRKRPVVPHRCTIRADGDGAHAPADGPTPTELYLEATDPTGEIAVWFDDAWWLESLQRWGGLRLAIHILPSQAALLHPVVLHHVAMVKRVAPNWRVVGYAYLHEINGEAGIERLATSAYDEVRFVDGPRPNCRDLVPAGHTLRIEDLFSRVRRIQQQGGTTRPMLVRTKLIPPAPGDAVAREAAATGRLPAGVKGQAVR